MHAYVWCDGMVNYSINIVYIYCLALLDACMLDLCACVCEKESVCVSVCVQLMVHTLYLNLIASALHSTKLCVGCVLSRAKCTWL